MKIFSLSQTRPDLANVVIRSEPCCSPHFSGKKTNNNNNVHGQPAATQQPQYFFPTLS